MDDNKHVCEDCGRPIKPKLIALKQVPPTKCHNCYCVSKGKLGPKARRDSIQRQGRRKRSILDILGMQAE